MVKQARRRAAVPLVATTMLLAAVSACGTRASDSSIISAEAGPKVVTTVSAGTNVTSPTTGDAAAASTPTDAPTSAGDTAGAVTDAGSAPVAGGPTDAGTGAAPNAATTTTTAPTGATSSKTAAPNKGAAATTAAAAGSASAPCTSQGAPIVIGQVLATSGVIGAAIANQRQGLALWAKAINAAGGLQCHQVTVFAEDDGADPARTTSNFADLIQNKKAIAIVSAGEPLTMPALVAAAEQAKIPIVGGDSIAFDWNQSPVAFPQGASSQATFAGAVKTAAAGLGGSGHKAGILYCVEASICGLINQNYGAITKAAGVTEGTSVAASLTQADFTAECQRLKSDGDDIVFFAVDGSAISRAARSCAALNYHPAIATVAIAFTQAVAMDANARTDGAYLGINVIPYITNDTPGAQAFHAAATKFAPGQIIDQSTMNGWSSGKLFEAAINNLGSAARNGPITTAEVFQGLYKVKDDDLQGLTTPLTFTPNQANAPVVDCYYIVRLGSTGLTAPNGSAKQCF